MEPGSPITAGGPLSTLRGLAGLGPVLEALRDAARRPDAPTRELVLIVHGTYANPNYPAHPSVSNWWAPRGSFGRALDAALQRHGSPARCDLPFDEWPRIGTRDLWRPRWYGWSGTNSEAERRRGAFALANHLRALQADDTIRTIHIVAHSHGGNVVRRALRYLNQPQHKLGRVICMGTPFLHFADGAAWRRWLARVHWPMLALLVAALAGMWWGQAWFNRAGNELPLLAVAGLAVAAIVAMWRFARSTEGSSQDVPMTALRFANDEAIQLLRSCAALTAQPHLFLRDLLGGPAPPAPRRRGDTADSRHDGWFDRLWSKGEAAGRAGLNAGAALSDVWNGPLRRAAEWLTTQAYRVWLVGALAGHLCTLLLIMAFRPYRPPLRPFLISRMPRLRDLFFHSIDEHFASQVHEATRDLPPPASRRLDFGEPPAASRKSDGLLDTAQSAWKESIFNPETMQSLVAVGPVVLYGLFFFPLDKLLGLPAWFGAVMTRLSILLGARAAAGGATGMDILGAAFEPLRTGSAPASVTEVMVPAAIEQPLEQQLDASTRVNFAPLRTALDPARRAMLPEALKAAFIDPAMLHTHYYQEQHIVDHVARLIARTGEIEWVAAPAQSPMSMEAGSAATPAGDG